MEHDLANVWGPTSRRDESHDGHGNHPQMAINSFWENPRGGSESGLNVYVKVLKNGFKNVGQ